MRLSRFISLLAVAFALSCTESSPTDSVAVATVELTAPSQSVRTGSTLTLGVRIKDENGNALDNVAIYWSSNTPGVASVSSVGVVTAHSPGEVTISASALGKSATTKITITAREVATVQLNPTAVSVRIGTTVPLAARLVDAEGETLTGRMITWSSSNTAIATVNSDGVVTGVAAGPATITATSEGRSGTAAITVTLNPVAAVTIAPATDTIAVGTNVTLVATLRDQGGTLLSNRLVSWNSVSPQIAAVSSTGVVTALSPGTTQITAVSEGRAGSATVVVLARLASSVTLSPSNASVVVGTTLQLSSQVTDESGNILPNRPVTYSSDNTAVATVNGSGMITAVTPGTAKITANSETRVGTATITVLPLPVASVRISPDTATIFTGSTRTLGWQALSTGGTVLSGHTIAWTSGSPSVATVSTGGVVTPVSPGTALIVGVVDGIAGFATITVRQPTVSSVVINGPATSMTVGQTLQLTAMARDNGNNTLPTRPITWLSSNENIAFVTSSGAVIGLAVGSVTISATADGVSGSYSINVR